MDIHVGRFHSDDFECGVCDVIYENLETHLKTCEIFRCRNCGKLEKTLFELKEHIVERHANTHQFGQK